MPSDNLGEYSPESVKEWAKIVRRHAVRDRIFIGELEQYLVPGRVLELGAACGQIADILRDDGYDVVTSDLEPFFVDYMKQRGLDAHVIDATNIAAYTQEQFHNVLSQGLTPQMVWDQDVVEKVYRSVAECLHPGGRYVSICGNYNHFWKKKRRAYRDLKGHFEVIDGLADFKLVKFMRHQIVPAGAYSEWTKRALNALDLSWLTRLMCNRLIFVLEKV